MQRVPVGRSIRERGSRLVPNDIDAISIDISISISISINADTGSNVTRPPLPPFSPSFSMNTYVQTRNIAAACPSVCMLIVPVQTGFLDSY